MSEQEKEKEKSLYSDIWDDAVSKDPQAKLDFYDVLDPSNKDSHRVESALDITKNISRPKQEGLREKTEKLFNIAKNVKSPKLIDWKNSKIHSQLKEGTLFEYNKKDSNLYRETDLGKSWIHNRLLDNNG
jgi:hypothetical protein